MVLAGVEFAVIRELEATSDEYGVMQGRTPDFSFIAKVILRSFRYLGFTMLLMHHSGKSYPVSSESLVEWEPVY